MNHRRRRPAYTSLDLERAAEVRHLHGLWRLGPPEIANPNPAKKVNARNPNHAAAATATPPCLSVKSNDKKEKDRLRFKKRRDRAKARKLLVDQQVEPEKEWPTIPSLQPAADGWEELAGKPPLERPVLSEADEARATAGLVQGRAYKAAEELFAGSSSEDEEDDSGDAMDADKEEEEEAQSKALDFFLGVFEKDGDLREYYEKNRDDGWFSCLVCERNKAHKTFKDCVRLVHHSRTITKTRRRIAHRAFGTAVCRVLGWDASRLPSIVLDQRGTLSESLANKAAKPVDNKQEESSLEIKEDVSINKEAILERGDKYDELSVYIKDDIVKECIVLEQEIKDLSEDDCKDL